MPIVVKWSADSISGTKKPANDDAWLVFAAGADKSVRCDAEGEHDLRRDDLVIAISDGMGGGQAGDLASRLLLTQLSQIIPKTIRLAASGFNPDYLEQLEEALHAIHTSINNHGAADEELKGMAATITLAWFTPENIYVGHVGDSRLYRHRNGETQQLTEDHVYAWRKFHKGEISEMQYRMHPKRSVLNEVMGGGHRKLRPSVMAIPYNMGDRFMLCSDGIIDGMSQRRIHEQLSQNEDSTNAALNSLISTAVNNSGYDDTTCIVFDVS